MRFSLVKDFFVRTDRGVTLIEVLVSGVLVSLSAIGILGVFTSGYMAINKAKIVHRATELAREKMEELNNQAIEDIYPSLPGVNGGVDEFDGYAEDSESPFGAGNADGYLTAQKVVGQFVPGSDMVSFCPICGYANRGYVYTDWDDTIACTAAGLYIDSSGALDNSGAGGAPDGYIMTSVTAVPPCVYKIVPVKCQNEDADGNGIHLDSAFDKAHFANTSLCPSTGGAHIDEHHDDTIKCLDGTTNPLVNLQPMINIPRERQAGFFYRNVKVKPKRADAAYTDYQYQTSDVAPSIAAWQTLVGGAASVRRGQSRTVPLKEVESIVKWKAHGEEQSYSVKTILSRLVPKYGY